MLDKLRKTIQGLRQSLNMIFSANNFVMKKDYQSRFGLSNDDFQAQLDATVAMLHDLITDNVIVFGLVEDDKKLRATFEPLRKELSEIIAGEIKAEIEKQKPKIIVPGKQIQGAPRLEIVKK